MLSLLTRTSWCARRGGSNAGHTVVIDGSTFKFHLMPSGILNPNARCLIAPGVVLEPQVLISELAQLADRGVDIARLAISDRAHLVMPYHPLEDQMDEDARGESRLGTTGRGIGPAYVDKIRRIGFRLGDLEKPAFFRRKLDFVLGLKRRTLGASEVRLPSADQIFDQYMAYAESLLGFTKDTFPIVSEALERGRRILLEGAQAPMLDIDFGTYPYVTSCSTTAAGLCAAAGIPPRAVADTIVVAKAYATRVGYGPFPTEMGEEEAAALRDRAKEYGTTTGRARRIGWFDAAATSYVCSLSGATSLAITNVDNLTGVDPLRVGKAYRSKGSTFAHPMANISHLKHSDPEYAELRGWDQPLSSIATWDQLPAACQRYLREIETLTGVRVGIVSFGPARHETLFRDSLARHVNA